MGKQVKRLLLALLGLNLLIPFLFIWSPIGLGPEGDVLDYRLPLIQWALKHHAYPNFSWTYVDDYPALAETLMALASLVSSWGPRFISAAGYAFFVLGCLRLSKIFLAREWALVTTVLISAMTLVTTQDNLLMVDLFASAMSIWSLVYLCKCWKRGKYANRDVLKAGLFLGLALATRYSQLPTAVGLGALLVFIPMREKAKSKARAVALFTLTAVAVASPWLLRNWIVNGNPLFPLFTPLLGGKHFELSRHHEVFSMVHGLGFGFSVKDFLLLPYRFAFHRRGFDYSVGPYFLAFLPWLAIFVWLVFRRHRSRKDALRETAPLWAFFVLLFAWFASSRDARFLIHTIPLAVISGMLGVTAWCEKAGAKRFSQVFFTFFLLLGTVGTMKHAVKHRGELVANPVAMPQPEIVKWVNAHAGDGKLLLLERTGNLGFMRTDFAFAFPHVYSTSALDHRSYKSAGEFYRALQSAGIRYLYVASTEAYPARFPVSSEYLWNKLYEAPGGGRIYALTKKN